MENLLKYIVTSLVDKPEEVSITTEEESERVTIVRVTVDKDDVGKVIGRNGKIANSIRTIVKSVTLKSGKRYVVKIGGKE